VIQQIRLNSGAHMDVPGPRAVQIADELAKAQARIEELTEILEDARSYITPTISTHEEISTLLGWCDCGYCTHVARGDRDA